ncbi:hypothetical protein [Clostridium cellulovorans]|uniref:Uncharacterized protein n=1 Tax=Clostridium cellulovorans (strain ATCC 35296 / DSM 3052 / OCM 3 / 743B) TaxID=573061 RepID=D9SVQ9_CLOC7|nr:hypothetical protein [Clostridium cellulovorans]ADL53120.1 hypothetical protein Clocel_3442 [Clostridium cellulovorans 743B]
MDLEEKNIKKKRLNIKFVSYFVVICLVGSLVIIGANSLCNRNNNQETMQENIVTAENGGVTEPKNPKKYSELQPKDNSPINYNSLRFAETVPITPSEYSDQKFAMVNVAAFSEGFLNDSELVFKGTVTNAYYKTYKYDTYSDKFEKNGILHNIAITVVYEMKIEDILYSKENFKVGDTIKIENQYDSWSFPKEEEFCKLKVNHQYIIPVDEAGENIIYSVEQSEYASGDIKRDSKYAINYPYAPQIEVTLDNQYIFHTRWPSLINGNSREVIVDGLEDPLLKFKMRDDENFLEDLKRVFIKISK